MAFHLYKSSAGSGKTYTLVKEYLKIILGNPEYYKKILAVTFTNDAAGEMKIRIINKLNEFSKNNKDTLFNDIKNELNLSENILKKRSEKVLKNILHSYSDFSVMTIDSFIFRIMKSFSVDLNLPLSFDVDMDIHNLTRTIVDNLLDSVEKGSYLADIITKFALSKINTKNSWNIETELIKMGNESFKEKNIDYHRYLLSDKFGNEFWKNLIEYIRKKVNIYRNTINNIAGKAVKEIEDSKYNPSDFQYKNSGNGVKFYKLAEATTPEELDLKKRFRRDDRWLTKSDKKNKPCKVEFVNEKLEPLREKICDYAEANEKEFISNYLILENIYAEAVLREFEKQAEKFKENNNIIPISDFGKKVNELISRELIPFIFWRIGTKYKHYLIDEFQDTSRLQWYNLYPLVDNSAAVGNFNLAVGDGKQAIYRWRAGDVEIMENEVENEFNDLKIERLGKNYRSCSSIVAFNNDFFADIYEDFKEIGPLFEKIYQKDNVLQGEIREKKGYVKVNEISLDQKINVKEKKEKILDKLVEDIKKILGNKNGFQQRDISILVRKNRDGNMIADRLFKEGIEVVSPDSMLLSNSRTIRFIISLLKVLNSRDNIAKHSLKYLHPDESLDKDKVEQDIKDKFLILKSFITKPLYEIVENIVILFELNSYNPGFLQGFLDVIHEYSNNFKNDIKSFLNWWEDNKDSDKCSLIIPKNKNAVRISTIHKAKGLEFPIVFVPFSWPLKRKRGKPLNSIWVEYEIFNGLKFPFLIDLTQISKESYFQEEYFKEKNNNIIDNINLMYVAFTRAVDRLYLYVDEKEKSKKISTTSDLIRSRIEKLYDKNFDNDGLLEFGLKEKKEQEKTITKSREIKDIISTRWRKRLIIKKHKDEFWRFAETDRIDSINRGLVIHDILSNIIEFDKIDEIIENAYLDGVLRKENIKEYKKLIKDIMQIRYSGGIVKDWFENNEMILNETSILTSEEEYRPDRVIINDQIAEIVDYKTGEEHSSHKKQIKNYGNLFLEMGYKVKGIYLLYIDLKTVVEIEKLKRS